MPLPKEPRDGISRDLGRPTLSTIRMEHINASKGGSTPDPCDDRWILRRPPTLTYFLLASPNLEDEIHFKGGRFVTSQNFKFWNVINK